MCLKDTTIEVTPKPPNKCPEIVTLENFLHEADTYEPPELPAYVDVII